MCVSLLSLPGNLLQEVICKLLSIADFTPGTPAGLLTGLFGGEAAPQYGDCPTCIGPSSEALGSCAGLNACISSYDDRPAHFVTPWEFEESQSQAMDRLQRTLEQLGGQGLVMAVMPCKPSV